jgi:hypothetical protein
MKVTSMRDITTEMEKWSGPMETIMKETGRGAKWTDPEFLNMPVAFS